LSIAETLQKIFYVCKTGCQWRAIEGMDGVSCKTVYYWFRKWSKARVFEHAFYNLVHAYGNVTFNPLVCDTSFVKNVFGHDVVGRNPTDRGRNATKVSLLTDICCRGGKSRVIRCAALGLAELEALRVHQQEALDNIQWKACPHCA